MLGDFNIAATIAVKDIDSAKKFYGDVLGLEMDKEDEGGVTYKSGNGRLYVYPSEYAGTNKATYAGWSVEDLESVVNELKSKGVTFEHYDNMGKVEGDIHTMGDYKAAWFKDPDGNILAVEHSQQA